MMLMKKKITLTTIIILLISFFKVFSQDFTVKGRIVDYETNQELIGITIFTDSTNDSTISDIYGNFKLNRSTSKIEMYYIGFYTLKLINIPKNQNIDFGDINCR